MTKIMVVLGWVGEFFTLGIWVAIIANGVANLINYLRSTKIMRRFEMNYSKLNNKSIDRLICLYQCNLTTPRQRVKVEKIIRRKLKQLVQETSPNTYSGVIVRQFLFNRYYEDYKLTVIRSNEPSKVNGWYSELGFPKEFEINGESYIVVDWGKDNREPFVVDTNLPVSPVDYRGGI